MERGRETETEKEEEEGADKQIDRDQNGQTVRQRQIRTNIQRDRSWVVVCLFVLCVCVFLISLCVRFEERYEQSDWIQKGEKRGGGAGERKVIENLRCNYV